MEDEFPFHFGEIFRFQLLAYDGSTGHHIYIYCEDSCERSTGCLAKERDYVQQACNSCLRARNGKHTATRKNRRRADRAGGDMDGVRSPLTPLDRGCN